MYNYQRAPLNQTVACVGEALRPPSSYYEEIQLEAGAVCCSCLKVMYNKKVMLKVRSL